MQISDPEQKRQLFIEYHKPLVSLLKLDGKLELVSDAAGTASDSSELSMHQIWGKLSIANCKMPDNQVSSYITRTTFRKFQRTIKRN